MSRFDDLPLGGDESGRSFLVHAPRELDHGRAMGALVGLAVGDALGTTLEFTRPTVAPLPTLLAGPHREIIGGGPFSLAPGQVTDDTQMATTLARALMEDGGFRAESVAKRYEAWGAVAFDVGAQTRSALTLSAQGEAAPGRAVWERAAGGGRRPAGNGSLMRTVPIALFYANDAARLREVSLADAALTHFDFRCQLACAAYNAAVALAATAADAPAAAAMVAAARAELEASRALLGAWHPEYSADVDAAAAALAADLDAATADDPDLYGAEVHFADMGGFVRVAFRVAFWHLAHTDDFEAALVDVVNRGADADTNGAITGALLGARLGVDAIPARWRAAVDGALAGQSGPWATTYHPRELFALLHQPSRGARRGPADPSRVRSAPSPGAPSPRRRRRDP